jgi:DNA polymerase bacteriophage-type
MPVLVRDIETRSEVDVGDVGVEIYAGHPSTEILCLAYCVDAGPTQLWTPGKPIPKEYKLAAKHGWTTVAHNVAFEIAIERYILGPRHGFPVFPIEQNVCTMAMANAMALPGGLDKLAKAINLTHLKDAVGNRIMKQLARPRRAKKGEDSTKTYFVDDQEKLQRLYEYCIEDVEAEREAFQLMEQLSEAEYKVWLLDQKINKRGFYIDTELAKASFNIIEAAGPFLEKEMIELTGGEVTSINQVARLTKWLSQYCDVTTLRKGDLDALLDRDDLPEPARRALELRYLGAQAATKKVASLLNHRCADGRVRDAFIYHAAGPGRWSSRGTQVHNLKRPDMKPEQLREAIQIIRCGDFQTACEKYDNPLSVIGSLIRSMICAPPGRQLMGGDFSGVEARVTAWVAGEESKLDVFRAFDAGSGPDPYVVAAAAIYGVDPTELHKRYKADEPEAREQRQIGKACELAFGYQGGVNAFKRFMPSGGLAQTPTHHNWNAGGRAGGPRTHDSHSTPDYQVGKDVEEKEIQKIKHAWRNAHPNIVEMWYALNNAAWTVVRDPNKRVTFEGRLTFECEQRGEHKYMWLTLPSGRRLCYPHIRIARVFTPPGTGLVIDCKGPIDMNAAWQNLSEEEQKNAVTTACVFKDNTSGMWRDVKLYGGLLTENVVQAISRDLLAEAMLRIDAAGMDIVAHIHDECVVETKAGVKADQFAKLMMQVPDWAPGLPIKVGPWISDRYMK